jgi:hypothetical protein
MRRNRTIGAGLSLLIVSALPAFAEENKINAVQIFNQTIPTETLAAERGGAVQINNETQIINTNTVNGTVTDVTVLNNTTGNNSVDGGAFTGAQGFPMVIQNSGNGVLIQNATILNVTVEQ